MQVLGAGEDVEATQVEVAVVQLLEQQREPPRRPPRTAGRRLPSACPEPLTSKSGLTRTATTGRIPSSSPAAVMRSTSSGDSISTTTPAATAWDSSATDLPGPAKLTDLRDSAVSRASRISAPEATSSESTTRAQVLHDRGHRVGLDRIAQVEITGSAARSASTRCVDHGPVVGEERGAPDPLREPRHRHTADRRSLPPVDGWMSACTGPARSPRQTRQLAVEVVDTCSGRERLAPQHLGPRAPRASAPPYGPRRRPAARPGSPRDPWWVSR